MKTRLLTYAALLLTLAPFERTLGAVGGIIHFNNRVVGTVVAPVFSNQVGGCEIRTGNRVSDTPSGSQTYSGAPVTGPGIIAELMVGPLGTPDSDLVPVARTSFRTGSAAGFFVATNVVLKDFAPGTSVRMRVRVYEPTPFYSLCLDRPYGYSQAFVSLPLGSTTNNPTPMVGLTAFCLGCGSSATNSAIPTNYVHVASARTTRNPVSPEYRGLVHRELLDRPPAPTLSG